MARPVPRSEAEVNAVTKMKALPPVPTRLANSEMEAAVIGMLLMDNRRVDIVADRLAPEDFSEPLYGRIYARIVQLVSSGAQATPITMRQDFIDDPAMIELGGPAFLAQLTGSPGILILQPRETADLLLDLAKRRRLHAELTRLTEEIEASTDDPVESLVDAVDGAMVQALQRQETSISMSGLRAFDAALKEIEDEASGAAPAGLSVAGFDDWNKVTGVMRRGEVIILAGRPSMGKTAVALSTSLACARAGLGTLFVSLEMSIKELMKRAISDLIFDYGHSANFDAVKAGKFTHFDRQRLATAREQLESWPLTLRQEAGLRLGRLAMLIRRTKRQMAAKGQQLDVVFIDYLGLVKTDTKAHKRYEEVSEVSRTIKQIARELDVAIVLLAQLNRDVEKREDKRPQLSDLRDSGDIEQDADCVIFVYREQYYLERSEPREGDRKYVDWQVSLDACRDKVELIAAKVRNGRIGKRQCHFFGEHQAVRGSDYFSSRRQYD
jgi:replicative DNA helicase